jgi:AcrR family transcriptional regulator
VGPPGPARQRVAGTLRKGEQTRAAIVEAALELAARDGLEGLTIGPLAERMAMSKSGVFAHFGSREDLQIAVLKAYERGFVDEVLLPSLRERRGLPRLRAIFDHWLERTAIEAARGCIWISGAAEYATARLGARGSSRWCRSATVAPDPAAVEAATCPPISTCRNWCSRCTA